MAQLLLHRIQFTTAVDRLLLVPNQRHDPNHLRPAHANITARRQAAILSVREAESKADRAQLATLLTLFQEQLDVLNDLMAAADRDAARAAWAKELKFREQGDGTVVCACGAPGKELRVGDDFPKQRMLVCTSLSREARRGIFQAMTGGEAFVATGPAGTGKTETVKDTVRMLGMSAIVLDGADPQLDAAAVRTAVAAAKKAHPLAPVVVDAVHRVPAERIADVVHAATDGHTRFAAFTATAGYRLPEACAANCVRQPMTAPDPTRIVQVLLASEGFTECDALGAQLVRLFGACRARCSQQHHYDFGLRALKGVCRAAGAVGHAQGFAEAEAVTVAETAALRLWVAFTPADRTVLRDAVFAEVFGRTLDAPAAWGSGRRWADVGAMVSAAAVLRHGVAVVGCGPTDVGKCVAAVERATGGRSIVVDVGGGEAAGRIVETVYGAAAGTFTAAFREAIAGAGGDERVNIIVTGDALRTDGAKVLEPLHSVLDDHKTLRLPETGEELRMTAQMRVVIITPDCASWSPAAVSRVQAVSAFGVEDSSTDRGLSGRIAALETTLVGAPQQGALLARLAALEALVTGEDAATTTINAGGAATGGRTAAMTTRISVLEAAV